MVEGILAIHARVCYTRAERAEIINCIPAGIRAEGFESSSTNGKRANGGFVPPQLRWIGSSDAIFLLMQCVFVWVARGRVLNVGVGDVVSGCANCFHSFNYAESFLGDKQKR